jgi:hypothetical protein
MIDVLFANAKPALGLIPIIIIIIIIIIPTVTSKIKNQSSFFSYKSKGKGTAVRYGPEGSKKFRLPDLMTLGT